MPLTAAAALGALIFGHVEFGVTVSIILGSVPAVLIGSLFSSRAPDKYIRPIIGFVIFASGLKYVGVPTKALGWTLGSILVAAALSWLAVTLVRRRAAVLASDGAAAAPASAGDGAGARHQEHPEPVRPDPSLPEHGQPEPARQNGARQGADASRVLR